MPLILVTGISTAGKSTMARELSKRGYEAYDTEHNGISAWYNRKTGKRVAGFNEMPDRTPQWLKDHEWNISLDWVKAMAEKAKDKPVFICGGSNNRMGVRALCDTVIWLAVDDDTIRRRVNNPRDHDYGTKPHELALTLKWNKINEDEHRAYGAVIIDGTQPLDKVVGDVVVAGVSPYETLGSKTVYHNPWMRVRENRIVHPNGKEGVYGVVESPDSVMVTVLNDKNQLYLIRAFSYPDASWNWELPGGGGEGEAAIMASKRELREETGITAKKWTLLGKTRICNGLMTERMSTYLAQDLALDETVKDSDGIISAGRFFDLASVGHMIREGRINDGQSITGITLLELHLDERNPH